MHPSFRASKATPYDESIHVPFVARWPGTISAGTRSDAIVSSVDMMPTILSLCGAETPVGVQGTDQSHHLLGSDGPRTDSAYLQILGPGWPHRGEWVGFWRGIRTERWVYARWFNDQYGPMLFDRDNDPDEMLNLADDPSYSDVRSRLEARLLKWMDDTDDPFDTGARSPDSGILELGQSFNHPMYDRKGLPTDDESTVRWNASILLYLGHGRAFGESGSRPHRSRISVHGHQSHRFPRYRREARPFRLECWTVLRNSRWP